MDVRSALRRRQVTLLACASALMLGALHGASAQGASLATEDLGSSRCARPITVAERFGTDVTGWDSTGDITFGDRRVPVSRPHEVLAGPPRGVAWHLWFHSWSWMTEVARDFGSSAAVDLAVAWHVANPDVGGQAPRQVQRETGWTEGAVTQRMTTVTCLWAITHDARLVQVMEALVAASLDESRYYGRPRVAPHNRGAMANLALIAAGEEFHEPEWVDAALRRLSTDLPEVFAPCGMDREQSASYFKHNYRLWTRAYARVAPQGDDSLTHLLHERLGSAGEALRALTLPSGKLPPIGDGSPVPGLAPSFGDPLHWWCQERGWAAGRDSWTQPRMHYTMRFGPAVSAHGHDDHGSLTWWVGVSGGASVLVDRGNPSKDRDPTRREWALSKAAHNTFAPKGLEYRTTSSARRSIADDSVTLTVDDTSLYRGITRSRLVEIGLDSAELVVTDSGDSVEPVSWIQSWHLDPDWSVVAMTDEAAIARHTKGMTLTITCTDVTGSISSPVKMRMQVVPQFGVRGAERSAHTVTCETRGSTVSIRTRLTVEG